MKPAKPISLFAEAESTLLSGQAKLENEGWAVQAMGSDREGATSPPSLFGSMRTSASSTMAQLWFTNAVLERVRRPLSLAPDSRLVYLQSGIKVEVEVTFPLR